MLHERFLMEFRYVSFCCTSCVLLKCYGTADNTKTARLNPFTSSCICKRNRRGALWWFRQSHSVNYANHQHSPFARRRHDFRQAAARRFKLHFPRYRLVKVSWKSVQPFPRTVVWYFVADGKKREKNKPDRQWRSSSFQESKKVRVSRDLWPWPWPWAHPGCTLTWSPIMWKFGGDPAICLREEAICAKVYRQTDRQTDRRRTQCNVMFSTIRSYFKPQWAR